MKTLISNLNLFRRWAIGLVGPLLIISLAFAIPFLRVWPSQMATPPHTPASADMLDQDLYNFQQTLQAQPCPDLIAFPK